MPWGVVQILKDWKIWVIQKQYKKHSFHWAKQLCCRQEKLHNKILSTLIVYDLFSCVKEEVNRPPYNKQ